MFSERGIGRFEKTNTETVMSKEFITIDQAINKLHGITTTGGSEYISKQNILLLGADPNLLTGYANTDFVAYDDVNKKMDNMKF